MHATALLLLAPVLLAVATPLPLGEAGLLGEKISAGVGLSRVATSSGCINPSVRVDFTTLTTDQQNAYFDAQNCLISKPANKSLGWPNAVGRWDDLVATHYYHANLTGGTDTWHHSRDAGNFTFSPTVLAFGGHGPRNVTTGPFANKDCPYGPLPSDITWSSSVPPSLQNLDHGLWRNVSETWSIYANQTQVNVTRNATNFGDYKTAVYSSIHTAGHFGMGGDMGHPMASPNDPLFFMHHMYLDARWWEWQQADPSTRTFQIPTPGPGQYTTQRGTTNMTLDTVLSMSELVPNVTVRDIADTQGGTLCYIYAGLE
ncbi:hypothetical protein RQP46_001047 [Phenoliferia psychrophenolica]